MGSRSPLATRREVAEYLGYSYDTLDRWAQLGRGPKYTRIGANRGRSEARYDWADVDAWLATQHQGGSAA